MEGSEGGRNGKGGEQEPRKYNVGSFDLIVQWTKNQYTLT